MTLSKGLQNLKEWESLELLFKDDHGRLRRHKMDNRDLMVLLTDVAISPAEMEPIFANPSWKRSRWPSSHSGH